MNVIHLVSFGGLIGLIYGISFLSMVENIELMFTFLTKKIKNFVWLVYKQKNEGRKTTKKDVKQRNNKLS